MKQKTRNSISNDASRLVCGTPALAEAIEATGISDDTIRDVVDGFKERFVVRRTDIKYVLTRLIEAQIEDRTLLSDLEQLTIENPDSILECGHYVEFESDRIEELRIMDEGKIIGWSKIFPRLQRVSESIVGSEVIPASHLAKVALNEFFNGVRLNYALYAGKSLDEVAVIWRKRFKNLLENIGNGRLIIQMVDAGTKDSNREMYELAETMNFFSVVTDGISFADTRQCIEESVDMPSLFRLIASRYGQASLITERDGMERGTDEAKIGKFSYTAEEIIQALDRETDDNLYISLLDGEEILWDAKTNYPDEFYTAEPTVSFPKDAEFIEVISPDGEVLHTLTLDTGYDYSPSGRTKRESIHVTFKDNYEFVYEGTELLCRKLKFPDNLVIVQADVDSWTEARNIAEDFDFAPWDGITQETWDDSPIEARQFLVSQHSLSTQPSKEWETLNESDKSVLRRIL